MSLRSYLACHAIAGALGVGVIGATFLALDAIHNGNAHALCVAAAVADRRPLASCDVSPSPSPVSLFPLIR